jgi:hypothetical protein
VAVADYVLEAHRLLKLDGHLHIIEATERFSDTVQFTKALEKLGFAIITRCIGCAPGWTCGSVPKNVFVNP